MKNLGKGWLLAAWLAASAMASAGTQTVEISKFAFTPKEVTVAPGTKVAWVNHDEIPHTVSTRDKAFTSKALDTDDRYEHVFDKEGDYAYFCAVHPYMTGVVHVRKP
ncbi:cupredoxin domain-containing protein [Chromobacterium violaceum]|uniref:Blue (type 1) copper domain-containing protein n=1 Tax=Chromobacterium violaceum (strain ATCC 12472 / DSM 30191 / JCM 1249 / CCUG 213 / NBRC 12614 / NCIMB 9131 / NCTC 9757 / MK) TaxID=243365 RepID=Q7NSC9_CHRVO|nr:cupredoxin family copper-binding protein [Chromobacterium violaceum]AAQ61158.1 conserved hypothetical protein [Chromobacterium violaceum ATCC 12472]ATP29784.1 amicyanin [Chromobacterium violaceum]ATP33691.1 amicyanin [Chromobacterium violaceum]MBT2867145.1 cupredoxin family copper-binding protein [Chromobacterium violaceum]MBX9269310.1 cupredoxin family copper-binding protein [Chromobacterium violaceum]